MFRVGGIGPRLPLDPRTIMLNTARELFPKKNLGQALVSLVDRDPKLVESQNILMTTSSAAGFEPSPLTHPRKIGKAAYRAAIKDTKKLAAQYLPASSKAKPKPGMWDRAMTFYAKAARYYDEVKMREDARRQVEALDRKLQAKAFMAQVLKDI